MKTLWFKKFEKDDKIHTKSLDKLNSFVLKLFSSIPDHYSNNLSKVKFLLNAVSVHIWALQVLIKTDNTTEKYRTLLEKLHVSIKAHKKAYEALKT